MNRLRKWLPCLLLAWFGLACCELPAQEKTETENRESFSVMAWNIWRGGREDGEKEGPNRVVDVIRDSGVDVVAMQETYGSGELISKELGFHFHPRGTNVSIHSRYPVVEDLSVFAEFKVVGGLIELPEKRKVAVFSIWLPYNKEIWAEGTRDPKDPQAMRAACQASCDDLKEIKRLIDERMSDPKYKEVPVIIAGDFNSMSYQDYRPCFEDQFEFVMDWPTSRVLLDAGYRDSYREVNPEVNRQADRTWTPRFPKQAQDRIDFVYYRGSNLQAIDSQMIDSHKVKFPSDHAAVLTRFKSFDRPLDSSSTLRVVSYNIKHGHGNDGKVDLRRASALLENVGADVIGLQEVDNKARRSGAQDQTEAMAKQLRMHGSFGAFMEYQGGQYGMAILSRHPIVKEHSLRLPEGREPRVAHACDIKLPNGKLVTVVNVHFDWIREDQVRFEQAKVVADYLQTLKHPFVLLGDFNDVKESRTLRLFSNLAQEASKPSGDRFTIPATGPSREIDFIFAGAAERWHVRCCNVLDGQVTSDHRPVFAVISLNE